MRVLLAGATGAIGIPLISALRSSGHRVTAVHRSQRDHDLLHAAGATPLRADVLDRSTLLAAVDGLHFDAVISQLSAMRRAPLRHRDLRATNRLRTEGTSHLLATAERVRATRFLTQSMVFGYGYGDFGGRELTESDTFAPPGRGGFEHHLAAMRTNEQLVLHSTGVEGLALRYGLFYGPGAGADMLVSGLRRRRLPVIRHGAVQPWIQLDDAAAATVAALEHGTPGAAYNIADDHPVTFSRFLTTLAGALGAPRPRVVPAWLLSATPYAQAMLTGGLRVSTAKAKQELGWSPLTPSYREGIDALASAYRKVPA